MELLLLLLLLGPTLTLSDVFMGCNAVAQYPCLPGIDAVGIGFDAVYGTSRGVGRQVANFSFTEPGQTWTDPFGNQTAYSFPDQAKVTQKTTQFLGHQIYRSVNEYVQQQSVNADVKVGIGPWFSASVDTQNAHSVMKDGLHLVAESTCELGIYQITLDPGLLLTPHPKLAQYVALLPDQYDPAAYGQFVADWGTHFVSSATLGGKARMSTTISQEYYSHQSDRSIQAQLQISWGRFGGGGGGGSSSHTHDATWTQNANSQTFTEGGDPAIKSFNSAVEWTQWAQSVETTSPIVTSYTLDPIHFLVPEGPKRANVQQAVNQYAEAHNTTFPAADPAGYRMGWCDCYNSGATVSAGPGLFPSTEHQDCNAHDVMDTKCQEGFFTVEQQVGLYEDGVDSCYSTGGAVGVVCCRPCFTASG